MKLTTSRSLAHRLRQALILLASTFVDSGKIWSNFATLGMIFWQRTAEPPIFMTPEWMGSWWQAHGKNRDLLGLVFMDRRSRVVGIAPSFAKISLFLLSGCKPFGEALSQRATVVVIPVERLDPAFFHLRSGLAGEFIQKIVNYRLRLAVIGDISVRTAESSALRDFVRESNRGRSIFFLPDLDALAAKLSAPPAEGT